MYHARFSGSHYEIGFRWGSQLAKHANYILNNIPFPITEERIRFAKDCLPIYQEYLTFSQYRLISRKIDIRWEMYDEVDQCVRP